MSRETRLLLAVILSLLSGIAAAHKPSDSYMTLDLRQPQTTLRWDMALRDLEQTVGIDTDNDRQLTWGEVTLAREAIESYALAMLSVSAGNASCLLDPGRHQLADHGDGTYAMVPFRIDCPDGRVPDAVNYRFLFDIDPSHRGLLRVIAAEGEQLHMLSPDRPTAGLNLQDSSSIGPVFSHYLYQGVHHILIGLDHILFLLTLILPAVLYRQQDRWHPEASVRAVMVKTVSIVTAFTLAHSITLAMAVWQIITPPGALVESIIAATVLLAALNNVRPFLPGRPWVIAFVLGLVHGFGFASVLNDLGLAAQNTAISLAGFNLGVELGQLLIVAMVLPLAWMTRRSLFYRIGALQIGSSAIAVLAVTWLLERSLNMNLLPL